MGIPQGWEINKDEEDISYQKMYSLVRYIYAQITKYLMKSVIIFLIILLTITNTYVMLTVCFTYTIIFNLCNNTVI